MKPFQFRLSTLVLALACSVLVIEQAMGQGAPATAPTGSEWTTKQDHQNMMEQLGIKSLRPGPSGRRGASNEANYDPAKANPYPDLPEVLTLKNGGKVTTAEGWWKQRRPEIVEDFEREVIGRVPRAVPSVKWSVTSQAVDRVVGKIPVNARGLIGTVDNSVFPSIEVKIEMTLVTPLESAKPVPVLIGELAWRQHDGGHEDRSNMKHFIAWASRLIHHAPDSPRP